MSMLYQETVVEVHKTTWALLQPGHHPIEVIDGIHQEEATSTPSRASRSTEFEYFERSLSLPTEWPDRMSDFFETAMRGQREYNCHMFAKWMLGMTDLTGTIKDMAPMVKDHAKFRPVDTLKAGELGAIVVDYAYTPHKVFHSLLGVDEESGLTLQVMEPLGDIGLALGKDVVDYYQKAYANSGLYAVPTELYG